MGSHSITEKSDRMLAITLVLLVSTALSSAEGSCVDVQTWCVAAGATAGQQYCEGTYRTWASNNCKKSCGLCGSCDTSTPWCALDCENSMCKYSGPSTACTGRSAVGNSLTSKDRKAILRAHNKKRQLVKKGKQDGLPAATKAMPNLKWDNDLAKLAQRWIEQCVWDHDTARKTEKFSSVGQNLYMYKTTTDESTAPAPWQDSVDSWYNEVHDYKKQGHNYQNFQGGISGAPAIGHFTQVIWAATTHVGCGYVRFIENKQGRKWYIVYVACNYGPAGNMMGDAIYN